MGFCARRGLWFLKGSVGDGEVESLVPTSWKRPSPGEAEPCGPPPLTPVRQSPHLPVLTLLLLIKIVGVEAANVPGRAGEKAVNSLSWD